jgi:hypothetical protein
MEFIEKIDVNAAQWLLSQLSAEFLALHTNIDEISNFTNIKKILNNYIKHKGIMKVAYKKSHHDKHRILRDYGNGIQSMPSVFRGLLCKNMTDVDMVNAHPSILLNLCKRHNISCHYLNDYCQNRKSILERGDATKIDILRSMNKKNKLKNVSNWLLSFDNEMKLIQQSLIALPEYSVQKEMATGKNTEGSFMSHLATSFEVKILHAILQNIKVDIGVLMFDGFMFYGEKPNGFLEHLSQITLSVGFDIQFSYKDHNTSLDIPPDWVSDNSEMLYQTIKNKYEKDYYLSFIQATTSYSLKIDNKILFFNYGEMLRQFDSEICPDPETNRKANFFSIWVHDNTKQTYKNVGVYPHDVECPDDVLNLWTGFAVSKLNLPLVDINPILHHIKIMSNHDEKVYEFLLNWLANMFQYPSSPSIFVSLCSVAEGTGKSTLTQFISNMLGKDKSYESTNPEIDLFGTFNGHLADTVFINVNEVKRGDMNKFYEKLKSAINSPTCEVHNKGQKPYTILNTRHYMATTNIPDAIVYKEGSRRYMISYVSEELKGNADYFTNLYNLIENKAVQYSFYRFLMERPVPKKFIEADIPTTQLMKEAEELNRDPIEDYASEFIGEHNDKDNYNLYKQFLLSNGLTYEMSKKSFDMRFSRIANKYHIDRIKIDKVVDGERIRIVYKRRILISPTPHTPH